MEVDPPEKDQNNGNPQGPQENKQGNRKSPGDKKERNTGDPTVAAWARLVKGQFRSFMSKSGHIENIAELTLSLEEDTAKQEILDGALEALAVRSGLDMSREDLLTALLVYRKRKGQQPDLVKGCFASWGAEAKQAEEKGQPKEGEGEQMMALGGGGATSSIPRVLGQTGSSQGRQ